MSITYGFRVDGEVPQNRFFESALLRDGKKIACIKGKMSSDEINTASIDDVNVPSTLWGNGFRILLRYTIDSVKNHFEVDRIKFDNAIYSDVVVMNSQKRKFPGSEHP